MYQIVENLINYPSTYGNSAILYCAIVAVLITLVCIIDMVYRILHTVIKSIERR